MNQAAGTRVAEPVQAPTRAPTVSVVLPCLDEEGGIASVVRAARLGIESLGLTGEVVVVDNGSQDRSAELAREAGARVVHEPMRGYGNALRRGLAEAKGDYVFMADADGTYPIDDLAPFVEKLEAGCDIVNGNRFGGRLTAEAMTWSHRYFGTPLLSWLIRRLIGGDLRDSQCGMRAFRRDALARLHLRAQGMEFASEMLVQALRSGLRVGEVPITLDVRVGRSKLRTIPDGWRHLRYLLVISPDYLFLFPGLALFALGLALLVLQLLFPAGVHLGSFLWLPRFAPVIVSCLGAQVIWLWLFALLAPGSGGPVGRLGRSFVRLFKLERALLVSLMTLLAGGAIEVAVALQQFDLLAAEFPLQAAGAFAILVGGQSFFSAFAAHLLKSSN